MTNKTVPKSNVPNAELPSTLGPYFDVLERRWKEHLADVEDGAPTVVSTFAGCGGSSLGYSMAGFRELAAVDWNEHAKAVFQANFDAPYLNENIYDLSSECVLDAVGLECGELDLLDGSPPCQGFSAANSSGDFLDSRNRLYEEFARLLRGIYPRVFVVENVPGMLHGAKKLLFKAMLAEFSEAGYNVTAKVLDGSWLGVPQRRKRLIFVGVRTDLNRNPVFPSPKNQQLKTTDVFPSWSHFLEGGGPDRWRTADKPFPTIPKILGSKKKTGYFSGGHFIRENHGEERRPTATEVQVLQSFPPQFEFVGDRVQRIERIGNSVPPAMMREVAVAIRRGILYE